VAKDNDDQQSGSTDHRVQGLSDIWTCDRPQAAALATQASRIWYLVYLQLQQESSCYCCTYSSHEPSHTATGNRLTHNRHPHMVVSGERAVLCSLLLCCTCVLQSYLPPTCAFS
jgi:hypothetical protein